ncbi:MAG: hypothetical protein LC749_15565 [Actinobacteria bacterium]|nr:hypothetical protein [Actinomycetota bacterium]
MTSVQERAQTLVEQWSSNGRFEPFYNSPGTNEGIVVAAAGLLEDSRACRPDEYLAARDRLADARRRAVSLPHTPLDSFDYEAKDVWEDSAAAAYTQIKAIAKVSPTCG